MDWAQYILKVPAVVAGITGIINMVKGASDKDKKEAVMAAVMTSVSLAEYVASKDLLKDEQISKLMSSVVEAEMAVLKARDALKEGLLAAKTAVVK